MGDPSRLVELDGPCNFRDLGGYPATGGRVRWRRVFRSDALHTLSTDDLERLAPLALRHVVDLRTGAELTRSGPDPLGADGVARTHLSVLPTEGGESAAAPAPAGDDLAERYLWYLEVGRRALVGALGLMAQGAELPLVFHCTAGKDRTGVLSALLLGLLGAPRAAIVEDYAMTAERLPCIVERLRADPHLGPRLERVPASRLSVEGSTMERFLDRLDERYGGAQAWALGAGLGEGSVESLRRELVEPSGPPR